MAENTNFTEKGFNFKELSIISSNGTVVNIYPQLIELTIFEDIYGSTLSGHIIMSDSVELPTKIPLSGFEFLSVIVEKPGYTDNLLINKVFRIYKFDSNTINQTTRSNQTYTLHFCSEENVISLSRLLSKSYRGFTSSSIIKDILLNQLFVSPEKYNANNIEESFGRHDIIIPYMHPLQAANWISSRSLSLSSKNSSSNFMFYENRDGYNFKSLEKLFYQPTKIKYKFNQKNIDNIPDETTIDQYHDVIQYQIMNMYDILNALNSGMYSSVLKGIDLTRMRADDTTFNYNDFFNNSIHINNDRIDDYKTAYPFHNNMNDRLKNKIYENYFSTRRIYPTNKNHDTHQYISKKQPGINQNLVERWMLQRISQINQLNFFKLKLVMPGDTHLTVGDIIEFKMPLIESQQLNVDMSNPYYSGRYLVTAIRHKLDYQSYEMIAEVTKDCLNTEYPVSDNDDRYLREIKKL